MTQNKAVEPPQDFGEYQWTGLDVMTENDARFEKIKYIIDNRLTPQEKDLVLKYAEVGSSRKLAAMLGVSHAKVQRDVFAVRWKILGEMDKMGRDRREL